MRISIKPWLECLILSVISFILYRGFTVLIFLAPLQLLYFRHGKRVGFICSFFSFLAFTGILLLFAFLTEGINSLFYLNLGMLFAYIGLQALANYLRHEHGLRAVLIASICVVCALIFVPYMRNTADLSSLISVVTELLGQGSLSQVEVQELTTQAIDIFSAAFSLALMIPVFLGLLLGLWIHSRLPKRRSHVAVLVKSYRLPSQAVWVFFAAWILVALRAFVPSLFEGNFFFLFNIAFSIGLLYLIQGIAATLRILDAYGLQHRMRSRILILVTILCIFFPFARIMTGAALTLLGVGEMWITYPSKK